tara:strand:- start:3119 stop:3445 length:327 start_codon:yes stop_codon:yes gene_type:complete
VANEARKAEYTRIQVDFTADCDDDGMCIISEDTLNRLTSVISGMNDSAEMRTERYNLSVDSLSHCQYANTRIEMALKNTEDAAYKADITNMVKNLATVAGCGVLLWAK